MSIATLLSLCMKVKEISEFFHSSELKYVAENGHKIMGELLVLSRLLTTTFSDKTLDVCTVKCSLIPHVVVA